MQIKKSKKKNIQNYYRYTIIDRTIFSATFRIKKGFDYALLDEFIKMRANQPKEPSAGSAFKNPPGDYAGRLIEAVGLKGKSIGGMAWSDMHANFLVNLGGGRYEDAVELIEIAKRKVSKYFNINLELEIVIV